jgi:hypothetical protein
MFRHLMFSSPKILFVDAIFRQQIIFFLLRHGVMIVFRQLMFSSPKDLCGDNILRHQLFLFLFSFLFLFY